MDWQVGDLALCLHTRPSTGNMSNILDAKLLEAGRIYTVAAFLFEEGNYTLVLSEVSPIHSGWKGWAPFRFRKIKPDTEPCEEEFIALIKRMKPAKVQA